MAVVYLHIGTMKTGTSALQRFLDENRDYLKDQDYIYPNMNQGLSFDYIFRNGHFLVYSASRNREGEKHIDKQKVLKEAYEKIGGLAEEFGHIILSEEILWHYGAKEPDFWEKISEEFKKINCELKIVLYLRRQDALMESLYSHAVKSNHRFEGEFSDYLDGRAVTYFSMDYYENVKKIEEQIGKENLIIRTYEKERFVQNKNGIFDDFLEAVGLSLDGNYKLQRTAKNAGLEGNYLEFKRVMNGLPEYRESGNFMARPLTLASAVSADGKIRRKEGFFTLEERKAFMRRFEEGNRKLAEEYFGRKDGKLFREPFEELPAWQLDRENLWRDMVIAMTEEFCIHEKRIVALETEMKDMEKTQREVWIWRTYQKIKSRLRRK